MDAYRYLHLYFSGVIMFPNWEYIISMLLSSGECMKLIGLSILYRFCEDHTDCSQQITTWIAEVREVTWATPSDIKARYMSASFLTDNRVIFNIKGNRYRLDTKVYYQRQIVMVKRIGTHAEYDGWRF